MRGVAPFLELWERRPPFEMPDGTHCDLLALPDLLLAKKTQRDKDWPMIRRLVEAHYFNHRNDPNPEQIEFWLHELRTPSLLIHTANAWPSVAEKSSPSRALLIHAISDNEDALAAALLEEENAERLRDRDYWLPLKRELEALRMNCL